jgi:hypothetical protein
VIEVAALVVAYVAAGATIAGVSGSRWPARRRAALVLTWPAQLARWAWQHHQEDRSG